MKDVEIYTDGACSGNPGPGGYGVILKYGSSEKCLSQGYRLTTNNRMEILGLIVGLEMLKEPCKVSIYTDSKYVVDSIMLGWAKKWRENGWKRNKTDKAQNIDLWDKLLKILEQHEITMNWVKGHAGHEYNERCDKLAVGAYNSGNLIEDEGYEGR